MRIKEREILTNGSRPKPTSQKACWCVITIGETRVLFFVKTWMVFKKSLSEKRREKRRERERKKRNSSHENLGGVVRTQDYLKEKRREKREKRRERKEKKVSRENLIGETHSYSPSDMYKHQ